MKAGFVSLVGRPNAGKSTLLNRVIGTKLAIVSDKPQTTRNRILAVKNYPDAQIVWLDTPGVHRPLHRMNVRMMDQVTASIREVDVLGVVVDATARPGGGDRFLLDLIGALTIPLVLALNKIDLVAKPRLLPLIEWYRTRREFAAIVPVSALTGDGVETFEGAILENLPDGEALYPQDFLTDQPERALAAEMVREQILQHTRDELPFSTAVVVDRFEEPDARGLLKLYCSILVEHESQKPILLGKAGQMIKRIGTAARHELERFFGVKVHLDLHVKVRPHWREDPEWLRQIGLQDRRS